MDEETPIEWLCQLGHDLDEMVIVLENFPLAGAEAEIQKAVSSLHSAVHYLRQAAEKIEKE